MSRIWGEDLERNSNYWATIVVKYLGKDSNVKYKLAHQQIE